MKPIIGILKWISISLIVLFIVILSSNYLRRYTFLNVPDVYDYKKLPIRMVENDKNLKPQFFSYSESKLSGILPLQFNGEEITNLDRLLETNFTTAFIIIKNDTVVYEKYFNGHERDTYCKSFSASKNFISALIGIAIDERLIDSVNDPVIKYIPEFSRNEDLTSVTINHCLSGTAGFPANNGGAFPWHDNVKTYYSSNLPKLLSKLNCKTKPGTHFQTEEYSSCLLALVLEKVTKMTVSEYLSEKIWEPVGMEYEALWVLDRKKNGHEVAMSGLTARPIDLARFGCLFLHEGNWNGKQIISEDWVNQSTSPDSTLLSNWDGGYYNKTWWGTINQNGTYEFSANGHFAQRIYVAPSKNAVIVRFGYKTGNLNWSEFISSIIGKM